MCDSTELTDKQGKPWIINAVGAAFIGFAIGGTGDMALTYVQDSYQLVSIPRPISTYHMTDSPINRS